LLAVPVPPQSTIDGFPPLSQSSIVVAGVPTKNYKLPSEWIQKNTTVVNVASFKNVDEEEVLKIPGVVYVSMVGKVTVAMLERNLMRLYEQFHSPRHPLDTNSNNMLALHEQAAWSLRLQAYSAAVLTLIFAIQLMKN
jgi:hypothetical protein